MQTTTTKPLRSRWSSPAVSPSPGSIRISAPLPPRASRRSHRRLPTPTRLASVRALDGLPDSSKLPTISSSSDDDDDDDDARGDENDADGGDSSNSSEVAVLLAACGVGIATGLGVVLLNDAVDAVRALAWSGAPLEATDWGRWARSLPLEAALPLVLLPPTAAGLAVGALRAAAGGSLDDSQASSGSDIKLKAPLLRAAAAALSLGKLVEGSFFFLGRGIFPSPLGEKTHPSCLDFSLSDLSRSLARALALSLSVALSLSLSLALSTHTHAHQAAEPPWVPRARPSTSASPSRGGPPPPSSPKAGRGSPSPFWRRARGPASPRASARRCRGRSSRSRRCSCGGGRAGGRAPRTPPRASPSRRCCSPQCWRRWPRPRGSAA